MPSALDLINAVVDLWPLPPVFEGAALAAPLCVAPNTGSPNLNVAYFVAAMAFPGDNFLYGETSRRRIPGVGAVEGPRSELAVDRRGAAHQSRRLPPLPVEDLDFKKNDLFFLADLRVGDRVAEGRERTAIAKRKNLRVTLAARSPPDCRAV